MKVTERKDSIRPLLYEWAHEFWEKSASSPWWHKDISMREDKQQWDTELSVQEKNVIGNILKGFAQTESEVSNYWSVLIPTWFPVHEIKKMAMEFAARECIHGEAYNYLNDYIGLHDYDGFRKEESIANRLESLMSITNDSRIFETTELEKALSIAIFSAACEGVQLFSAFAILLSFRNRNGYNKLVGVASQMEWSVKDENLHSVAGCKLFRTMCEENPKLKDAVKENVRRGMLDAVYLEKRYLDKIFEMGDIPTISKDEVIHFLHDRANIKFQELGYEDVLFDDVDKKELERTMGWFSKVISSNKDNDTFSSKGSAYSKPNDDWDDV